MIGKFDERITIKPLAKSSTGTGGNTASYTANNLSRWAMVEDITQGRETVDGMLVMSKRKRFTIRWDSSVEAILLTTSVITYDSVNYTIIDYLLYSENGGYFYKIVADGI